MRYETEWLRYEPCPGDPHAPSATPIYQTATFRVDSGGEYDYTRSGNPTRRVLEEHLARLERGSRGLAFASGMAAIAAVASLVEAGESILAATDLYGGTYRYFTEVLPRQGARVDFADDLVQALSTKPRLVFLETPSNPFQRVTDLYRLAAAARASGTLLAVDNSLASPYLQNPLVCGADLVVHSATKYLSGHGDATGGAVVTREPGLGDRIAFHQNACGTGLPPFEAFLLARGMKTLPLRLERQQATASLLASALASHARVKRIHYPGLPDHPARDVHFRQARGAGAVISFETGSIDLSLRFVENLRLFSRTVSFGSVSSTASLPARMSHASIAREERSRRGFPEDLVRLSVGVEHPDDLMEDVMAAL
jgi:cystathionine beta-lyase